MALNSLFCVDVPLSNYSLTHSITIWREEKLQLLMSWKICWYAIRLKVLYLKHVCVM